jgi:hypothetical protein
MVESAEEESSQDVDPIKEARRQARENAKPWLVSDTVMFGKKIAISPATFLTVILGLGNLITTF